MNSDYLPRSFPTNSPPIPPPWPESPPEPIRTSRVGLWRWWIATILMGSCPLLVGLMSLRHGDSGKGEMLPHSALGLLLFCAIELGMFGIVWGICWAFARGTKDDLFLRWHKSWVPAGFELLSVILVEFGVSLKVRWQSKWAPFALGLLYSFLMRFGLVFILVCGVVAVQLLGGDVKHVVATLNANGKGAKDTFEPVMNHGGALYRLLMVTLVSFVVAGTREELWRTFTMAGMLKILPSGWSTAARYGLVLAVSSFLFGMGHVYQGATGVVGGALLGVALGAMTLHHKSIWPAVIAHGCFDSLSFLLLLAIKK